MTDADVVSSPIEAAEPDAANTANSSVRLQHHQPLWAACLLAVAYVAGVHVGLALTFPSSSVSTLWPPNAIVLAALLLMPPRTWWLLIAAVLPAHLITQTLMGVPFAMSACWFVSNVAEALLGAALTLKYCGRIPRFDRVRDVSIFLLAGVVIAPFLTTFLDAAFVALIQWRYTDYWQVWRTRFFSNALAILILVPLIVLAFQAELKRIRTRRLVDYVETGGLVLATCIAALLVFRQNYPPAASAVLLYAPLPILMWAAIRKNVMTLCFCVSLVALIAIAGALDGLGPFTADVVPVVLTASAAENAALAVQTFLIIAASSLMLLAASLAEMRQARAALRVQKERLDLALEAAQMGTWEWDIGRDRINWEKSQKAPETTHARGSLSVEDLLNRIHDDDRALVLRTMHNAVSARESKEIEYRFEQPDGDVRWITSRGKVSDEPDSRSRRVIGVYVDTTDRKIQELQMRTHQEQLTYLSRVSLMGELAGALAHELNQPLAAILLNAESACSEIEKPDANLREIADTLQDIVSDDKRAGEVIRRLRALFVKGVVQMRPVSVNECIAEVLDLERNHLIARQVAIEVQLADALPFAMADRVQLQQVLLNLIVNACDAMTVNPPNNRKIHLRSAHTQEGVAIHVRDNGEGFKDAEAIFQPFFSTKDHGIGLGLAVSRRIIAGHRGRLWATSNADRGSTFHILLTQSASQVEPGLIR